jgi:hypothetical protein
MFWRSLPPSPRVHHSQEGTAMSNSHHNAVRHGLCATTPVIPGLESQGAWEQHRVSTLERLAPADHLEESLAERVALILWRLGRVARYERHATAHAQAGAPNDVAIEYDAGQVEKIRKSFSLSRMYLRAFDRFRQRRPDDPLTGVDAACVVDTVSKFVPQFDMPSFAIPGLFTADEAIRDVPGWTVARVRQVVDTIAEATGRDPDELLTIAFATARVDHNKARIGYRALGRRVEDLRNERILPQTSGLENATRYEKHLTRLLEQTLAQLRRLQQDRRERETPREDLLRKLGAHDLPPELTDLAALLVQWPIPIDQTLAQLELAHDALMGLRIRKLAGLDSLDYTCPPDFPHPHNPVPGTNGPVFCETSVVTALAPSSEPLDGDGTGTSVYPA